MEGVNESTVWTWNAVGKRAGAWNLDPAASEITKGFLLNHIITELLPSTEAGPSVSNSDPVTGQAAWYDLKVSLTKAAPEEAGMTEPRPAALGYQLPRPPRLLKIGEWFRERRAAGGRP